MTNAATTAIPVRAIFIVNEERRRIAMLSSSRTSSSNNARITTSSSILRPGDRSGAMLWGEGGRTSAPRPRGGGAPSEGGGRKSALSGARSVLSDGNITNYEDDNTSVTGWR